jgi:hypothetical protein
VGENSVLLAGTGYVYFQFRNTGIRMDTLTIQKAEDYCKHALDIDQECSVAHVVIALLKWVTGKPYEISDHFEKSLARENCPGNSLGFQAQIEDLRLKRGSLGETLRTRGRRRGGRGCE